MYYRKSLFALLLCSLSLVKSQQRQSKFFKTSRSLSIDSSKLDTSYDEFLALLKPILVKRVSGTPENKIVREYLATKMEEYGWVVERNSFDEKTPLGVKNFVNVVANLPIGTSFSSGLNDYKNVSAFHTNNRIVLACHYDSKYEPNMKNDFIGAIDSAVPCAMLLDLAKFLKDNFSKDQFKRISRHLQFLFFDGEEAFEEWTATDSIYGARNHASMMLEKYGQDSFDKIDLFVLLDLIGGDQSRFPNFFKETSNTYRLLSKIERMLIKKNMLSQKRLYYFSNLQGIFGYGGVQDDHLPFLAKDVPVLHLIPLPFPEQWHKETDNYENLNHEKIKDLRIILKFFLMQVLNVSKL